MLLMEDARKIIDELEGLPTLPAVVSELLERAEDPNATVGNITEIVENDPSLNAKILKLVNSAFYGLPRRVSSLKTAVSILGFNAIRNIVLATSIFNMFGRRGVRFDSVGFWIHCLGCAVGCTTLFRRIDVTDEHSEFVYGLLHDLGKIVMAVHMEETMAAILKTARTEKLTFHEAEKALEGVTHAQLGAALAERWRFPETLTNAIRYHHNVESAGAGLTEASVVHVSDTLARALQLGWCGDDLIAPVSEAAWDAVGLSTGDVGDVMDRMHSGLIAAHAFIDLIAEQ
ncbi:MAG TPA: HDOD domain-containing protein [Planctomycetota bacterium]|nr:HDOD domain-containing protein [Planctomycetota bacterium]